jgi:hypothetical protein
MVIVKIAGFPAPTFSFFPSLGTQNELENYLDGMPNRHARSNEVDLDDVPRNVFNEVVDQAEASGIQLNVGTRLMIGLKNVDPDGARVYSVYVKDAGRLNDPY